MAKHKRPLRLTRRGEYALLIAILLGLILVTWAIWEFWQAPVLGL